MMFGFKPYDTHIEIATKRFFISDIDECGIEHFSARFMKTVVSPVFHLLGMDRLHTDILEIVLVVWQDKAKDIDRFQIYSLYR